jgi:hypothetical protein
MSEAITFDNLPLIDHTRWAVDQAEYDPTISVDASLINQISSLASEAPYIESQLDALIGMRRTNRPWAMFPEANVKPNPSCFSRIGMLPQIEIEKLLQKVVIQLDSEQEGSPGTQRRLKRLIGFFETARRLEKILLETYSRIAQLQKG